MRLVGIDDRDVNPDRVAYLLRDGELMTQIAFSGLEDDWMRVSLPKEQVAELLTADAGGADPARVAELVDEVVQLRSIVKAQDVSISYWRQRLQETKADVQAQSCASKAWEKTAKDANAEVERLREELGKANATLAAAEAQPVAQRICDCVATSRSSYWCVEDGYICLSDRHNPALALPGARSVKCSYCDVTVSVDAPEEPAEEPVIRWHEPKAEPGRSAKGEWVGGTAYAFSCSSGWSVYLKGVETLRCNALAKGTELGEAGRRCAEAAVRAYLATHPTDPLADVTVERGHSGDEQPEPTGTDNAGPHNWTLRQLFGYLQEQVASGALVSWTLCCEQNKAVRRSSTGLWRTTTDSRFFEAETMDLSVKQAVTYLVECEREREGGQAQP